jgi:N-acetylmuramoyl-L-alanine amidase
MPNPVMQKTRYRSLISKNLIVSMCLFFVTGCLYQDEPTPEIINSPATVELLPPLKNLPETTRMPAVVNRDVPYEWFPPKRLERRWTAIVIHHSGTSRGNAAIFDRWHREGNHWEGVGYDFVIGNGSDSLDGEVEVTFRWREQRTGAHCGGTPNNWANERAVGICLVGNFNRSFPSNKQMKSLSKLVRFLQSRYSIPKNRIYGHNTTPGARATDCPGSKFPMARFKAMLDS